MPWSQVDHRVILSGRLAAEHSLCPTRCQPHPVTDRHMTPLGRGRHEDVAGKPVEREWADVSKTTEQHINPFCLEI